MKRTKFLFIVSVLFLMSCSFKTESFELNKSANENSAGKMSKVSEAGVNSTKTATGEVENSSIDLSKQKSKEDEKIIWQGITDNFQIVWSNFDLTYQSQETKESLFRWRAQMDMEEICKYYTAQGTICGCIKPGAGICSTTWEFRLLSVVGDFISFEEKYTGIGGTMRNGEDRRYTTIDISKKKVPLYKGLKYGMGTMVSSNKPNIVISLEELFDGKEILREFLNNNEIVDALLEKEIKIDDLKTASDLTKLIDNNDPIPFDLYKFNIPKDFLTRFAIYDIKNDKVFVKLSLPHSRSGNLFKEVSLKLSIPSKLKTSLDLAKQQNEGFLMSDANKIFGEQITKIKYEH